MTDMVQLVLLERDGTVYTDETPGDIKDIELMKYLDHCGNRYEIRAVEPSTKTVVGFAVPRVRVFNKVADKESLDYWLREIMSNPNAKIIEVSSNGKDTVTINYEVKV